MTTSTNFAEYEPVSVNENLRQGDILERTDSSGTPWNRLLLVITADCDLQHDKHQGRITCVPLLTKTEYTVELLIPTIRHRLLQSATKTFQADLDTLEGPRLTAERIAEWTLEKPPHDICDALDIPDKSRVKFKGLINGIKILQNTSKNLEIATQNLILAEQCLSQNKKLESIKKGLKSRVQNAFRHPPGDTLFLSSLAPGYEDGYFSYLRHLEQVWEPEISRAPARVELVTDCVS